MNRFLAVSVAACVVLGSGSIVHAQDFPVRALGKPFFFADVIVIPESPDSVRADFLWEIPYRELAFRKSDGYYRARYDVTIVFSRGGRQIVGEAWTRRVRCRTLAETRGRDDRAKGRKQLRLARGKYEARITVTDLVSNAASEAKGKLDASFRSGIGLSELRFVRYTEDGSVVSNPGHDIPIGEDGHVVRVTLHPDGASQSGVRVKWTFSTANQRKSGGRDTTFVLSGKEGESFSFEIPVPSDELVPGHHRLDVRVERPGEDKQERRKTDLFARVTRWWFESRRQDALDILSIVATDEEKRALKNASEEQWPRQLEEFWSGRDPSPGTAENEYRDSIHTRIETIVTSFQEPFRTAWKTDRGRVLLEYGRPDRRHVEPGSFDLPASELWEYQSPRHVFFFVDRNGSGEYWLQN